MDFSELVSIIVNKGIVFLRPDMFADPLEAYCPGEDDRDIETIKRSVNVLCWHNNEYESEAMWNLYAKNTTNAVAIRTTKDALRSVFDNRFSINEIKYIDYKTNMPDKNKCYLYKRKSFEHEKEVRLIKETNNLRKAPATLMVPLGDHGLQQIMKTIYISPYAPNRFDFVVDAILKKYEINSTVIHSNDYSGGIRI